jgi:hypothetical protein
MVNGDTLENALKNQGDRPGAEPSWFPHVFSDCMTMKKSLIKLSAYGK